MLMIVKEMAADDIKDGINEGYGVVNSVRERKGKEPINFNR